MSTLYIIRDADAFSHGDEIDFNYDPHMDTEEIHKYCIIVEESGNDRICGTITAVKPPVVHFTTPYSDQPLSINFDTKELRASGDGTLIGTKVRVIIHEDDVDFDALDVDSYGPLPDVID